MAEAVRAETDRDVTGADVEGADTGAQAAGAQVEGAHTGAGVHVTADQWTYQHPDRDSAAVSGLTLEIRPGERVLLAGASGAGKSTLLHATAGVLHHDGASSSGALLVDGLRPDQPEAVRDYCSKTPSPRWYWPGSAMMWHSPAKTSQWIRPRFRTVSGRHFIMWA